LLLALVYADAKISRLHEKVPYPTGLIHIDFHEVACLTSSQLATTSGVLPNKRLFDNQVRLGEYAERRTKGLLCGREEVQRRAIREV